MRKINENETKYRKIVKKQKGITLIALVITIIVLIILASITIGTLNGDNGILKNAGKAKEDTEISDEKEIISIATVKAMGKNNKGNLEEDEFQQELNNEIEKEGAVEVTDIGEEFEVLFTESSRYYTVSKNGDISEAKEMIKDNSPADISTGKDGEELEGRYEIWSIEDLVVLSNISKGKGNYIKNGEITDITTNYRFEGDTIYLMRTLNFNSAASYSDLSMTWSYDAEKDTYIIDESSDKNLREILTDKEGVGFIPISDFNLASHWFTGIFDGQNNEIQNLYENRTGGGGLFVGITGATIKNLGITNVSINATGDAGGIVRNSLGNNNLYNCYVSGNISGSGNVSGLASISSLTTTKIINCYNSANIQSTERAGGLVSYSDRGNNITIENCYNIGNVSTSSTSTNQQYNSVSGILGGTYHTGTRKIINTVNMGNLSAPKLDVHTIYYDNQGDTVQIENCYYLNSIEPDKTIINENSIEFTRNDEEVLNSLNEYVNAHKNDNEVELCNWIFDSNGLLTFEK